METLIEKEAAQAVEPVLTLEKVSMKMTEFSTAVTIAEMDADRALEEREEQLIAQVKKTREMQTQTSILQKERERNLTGKETRFWNNRKRTERSPPETSAGVEEMKQIRKKKRGDTAPPPPYAGNSEAPGTEPGNSARISKPGLGQGE